MADPFTWYAIGSLAVSAVGMGMQYSAERQASKDQASLTQYNYAVQQQNIRTQQAMAEYSAKQQTRQIETNALIARNTAEANAHAYDLREKAEIAQGLETQRRTREDHLRFAALQNARTAKSGVDATGSPVEVLADTARAGRLALNDAWYTTGVQADRYHQASVMERYGSSMDQANFGLQADMARAEGALAPIRARMQRQGAEFERIAGLNKASYMRSTANAGLVKNSASLLSQGYGYFG